MLASSAPARQQAHDLVDRLTPHQVSALINLFEPMVRMQPTLSRAPFCDELPIDAEEMIARRAAARQTAARTTAA